MNSIHDHLFIGRDFTFGRKKLSMVAWMQKVTELYSYYTRTKPDWADPHWYAAFKADRNPSEAVHDLIDGPEYEIAPELEAHVDADVMEAREISQCVS
jgi:hypothetical protein